MRAESLACTTYFPIKSPGKLFESVNPDLCNFLSEHCKVGSKLQPTVFFVRWSFFLFWFDVIFYALICWETQGVRLHFRCENTSLSQKQGSPLLKLFHGKAVNKPTMGNEPVLPRMNSNRDPVRKAHSRRWSAQAILPVGAVGMELIFQTKTCSFCREHPELPPVPR